MSSTPGPDPQVIRNWLDEVALELDAVKRLVSPPPNRLAAYHLQQAAEKLVKAVRLHRGLSATKEHGLEILLEDLPAGDPWPARMAAFERLGAYATTYRYPTPGKAAKSGPTAKEIAKDADELGALLATARSELLAKPTSKP